MSGMEDLALLMLGTGLLGLLVGSFLNVVILRLPDRLLFAWRRDAREVLEIEASGQEVEPADLVLTRSRCPRCQRQLAWWENVPVVSFLLLRGRCRGCKSAISLQYPAVEALTAILSLLVVWRWGWTAQSALGLAITWLLIAASGIDLRTQLLPDQLTLPLLWLALLASTQSVFVGAHEAIYGAVAGYLCLWSVYWLFKLLTGREGMGYGDFKLLAALGALCGVSGLLPIILLSSLLGIVIGGGLLWFNRGTTRAPIPFGPYLATAGWIQLLFGSEIAIFYQALVAR